MKNMKAGEVVLHCLASDAPHPGIPPEDQLFAPFIGSWDLEVEWFENGVMVNAERGEWHFAWVLEGRAIQDVWIVPPIAERHPGETGYEYGTSVRFHDPELGGWRSTWIGPVRKAVETFIAKRIGSEIVLEAQRSDRPAMKWVFSEIGEQSFSWHNFAQQGNGWDLTQRFRARRRGN